MLRAVDIMSRNVVVADRSMSVQEAAILMEQENVSSLLITQNGMPLGIVTETDMTRDVLARRRSVQTSVDEIMSSPLFFSSPDADIIEVANAMTANRIKKIPVLKGHEIVGVITQTDIVSHVFRAVRSLQRAHETGQLTTQQYAERFSSLFKDFQPSVQGVERDWYMRCRACGNTFMNPEQNGALQYTTCPRCGSKELHYDPSPGV